MANPVVQLRPVTEAGRVTGYVVWCDTGTCQHVAVETLKASAQSLQRKHAFRHRTERNRVVRSAGAS